MLKKEHRNNSGGGSVNNSGGGSVKSGGGSVKKRTSAIGVRGQGVSAQSKQSKITTPTKRTQLYPVSRYEGTFGLCLLFGLMHLGRALKNENSRGSYNLYLYYKEYSKYDFICI